MKKVIAHAYCDVDFNVDKSMVEATVTDLPIRIGDRHVYLDLCVEHWKLFESMLEDWLTVGKSVTRFPAAPRGPYAKGKGNATAKQAAKDK